MLNSLFSIQNTLTHKIVNLCGIKFKIRRTNCVNQLNYISQGIESIKEYVQNEDILHENDPFYMSKQLEDRKYRLRFYPCEEIFPENYYNDFITHDITEKYINLIRGLDKKSLKLINRILYRIISYAKYKKVDYFVEKSEYEEIIQILHPDIITPITLSNGYSAINGYCLSGFINCGAGVICKHFVDDIEDKNRILNGNIIDAGAYIGDSAIVLSDYTNCKVHAFEPEEDNFENLKRSIAINKLENKIIPVKCGLSDIETRLNIKIPNGSNIGAYLEENDETAVNPVETISIDKYVSDNKIEKIGLIKTDVEGFEQALLRGAYETIKRDKPVLIISTYHNFSDFWDIKPILESWNLGYTFKFRKPSTLDFCGDLCLLAEVKKDNI